MYVLLQVAELSHTAANHQHNPPHSSQAVHYGTLVPTHQWSTSHSVNSDITTQVAQWTLCWWYLAVRWLARCHGNSSSSSSLQQSRQSHWLTKHLNNTSWCPSWLHHYQVPAKTRQHTGVCPVQSVSHTKQGRLWSVNHSCLYVAFTYHLLLMISISRQTLNGWLRGWLIHWIEC